MKTTINYSNRETKAFDAVEDVKNWFGKRYDDIAAKMKQIKNIQQFHIMCSFGGVEGYPVDAWYDHFNGEGAAEKAWKEAAQQETRRSTLCP